jgi:hypothetical protein
LTGESLLIPVDAVTRRSLLPASPHLVGDDVVEFQRALNLRAASMHLGPIEVDADYGPVTASLYYAVGYRLGVPLDELDAVSPDVQDLVAAKRSQSVDEETRAAERAAGGEVYNVEDVLSWCRSRIGVTETGSTNAGPQISEWNLAIAGSDHVRWCGCFVGYGLIVVGGLGTTARKRFAYTPAILADARLGHNGFVGAFSWSERKPGDLVLYKLPERHPTKDEVNHVEILDADRLHTIGGNTSPSSGGSQNNGGGVWRKARGGTYVVACARPRYALTTGTGTWTAGLDRAAAPTRDQAHAARTKVGVRWWGVYIGGRTSLGSGWTPRLVQDLGEDGFEFLPVYCGENADGHETLTAAKGAADAADTAAIMRRYGWFPNRGIPVWLDIEHGTYASHAQETLDYVGGWCATLRDAGYISGLYATPDCLKAAAQLPVNKRPGNVWIASWVTHQIDVSRDPQHAAGMPDELWTHSQRAWQYADQVHLALNGTTLEFDASAASTPLAPPPPKTPDLPPWPGRLLAATAETWGDDVQRWQLRMRDRGWTIRNDGRYDLPAANVCTQFQQEKDLHADPRGVVGNETWSAAWTAPVT